MTEDVKSPGGISSIHDPNRVWVASERELFTQEVTLAKMRAEAMLLLTRGVAVCDAIRKD